MAAFFLSGLSPTAAADDYNPALDAWPIFRYWTTPEDQSHHFEALWPLFERHSAPKESSFYFRPLYNRRDDKGSRVVESDWLWPFGSGTGRRDLKRKVFYPLFVWDRETFSDGTEQKRCLLLPFLYYRAGRKKPTDLLIFPLGGVIHNLLGRKRVVIVLWPVFIYQEGEEARAWSVIHPIFTRIRWNDGGWGGKLLPLFGINRRPGKLTKLFVLWPLFQKEWMRSDLGEFRRIFIFPFYGKIDDPRGWEWTVLWPFFSHRMDKNMDQEDWWYPWPLLGHRKGKDLAGRTFRPIVSWESRRGESHVSYLWPLGWYQKNSRKGEEAMSLRLVPLFFREWEATRAGRTSAWQVWPLAKYRNDVKEGHLELPSIFPFRYHAELERNFGPFFRLFEYRRTSEGLRSWRVLWRFLRVDKGARDSYLGIWPLFSIHGRKGKVSEHRWNVLKGLVGYERVGEERRWRILYFVRFGSKRTEAEGVAEK